MASWSADISRLKKATPAPADFSGARPSSTVSRISGERFERDVGGERGLAHARAPGNDDQIRAVETAGLGVERLEAGGYSGKAAARIERLLSHLYGHSGGLGEALDAALAPAFFRDPVERSLGRLDLALGIDLLAGVESLLDHVAADPDQGAEQGELVNLLGEIAGADDRRAAPGELGEIGGAAELLHLLVRLEQRPESHRRGDHVPVDELQYLLVDPGVERLVEMIGPELELDVLGEPVVDHQSAEQSRLRVHILGQSGRFGRRRVGETDDVVGHCGTVLPAAADV